MSVNPSKDEGHETVRRISLRSKMMLAFGCVLMILGRFIDWPMSEEPSLPDTSLFLIILGGLLGLVGLLTALRHE